MNNQVETLELPSKRLDNGDLCDILNTVELLDVLALSGLTL